MAIVAFRMKLHPGQEAEYERRHREIWPELAELLRQNGVSEYRIFLDKETHLLFAIQHVEAGKNSQALGKNPVMQRWWAYMADLMDTHDDHSPVAVPLHEVFYMP